MTPPLPRSRSSAPSRKVGETVAELTFTQRVDDAILCAAHRLGRLREQTLRGGIRDFRQTCIENIGLDADSIWGLRVDRCNALLFHEDNELRTMALTALEREAKQ
jgi:hypothetical protein